jgi:predicted permease
VSLWRRLSRGCSTLLDRGAADRNQTDEAEHYLDQAAAAWMARGLSPGEARRRARLELGTAANLHEDMRSFGWENAVAGTLSDLRHAGRRLRAAPGFTAVALLTLALGIGATTAIFSVVEGILLKPLPYPRSEQLVALWHTAPGLHLNELNLAASLYFTYKEENRVFQDVGMWQTGAWTITGTREPEEVPGLQATYRFLAVLGVEPALGRGFSARDDEPRGEHTVLLSNSYWQSRFGGDASALGRRLLVDGVPHTIIGVLPASFQFMDRPISLLLPMQYDRANTRLISFCCQGVARLKKGASLSQANADVARMILLAPRKFPINPGIPSDTFETARIGPNVRPLKDVLVGDIGNTLWVLMGSVGILLLIASANVANLLLVRADGRRQELAVRAALGAGWERLIRELLVECLLLAAIGGACGAAMAYGSLRLLTASDLAHLPRMHEIGLDPVVLIFAACISLAAGLLFGSLPAIKYARPRVADALRSGGRSLSSSKERHRARSVLVVGQVALAMVLLVGSALMIRTFQALRHVDPGFSNAPELETMRVFIPGTQVKAAEAAVRMEQEILRKIEGIAGVSAAAITNVVPLESNGSNNPVYAEDQGAQERAIPPIRRFKFISPGYVSVMGGRLVAGRDLTWTELYRQTPVALVSENMARELWGDSQRALGKRIRTALSDDWREVIGVISDLRDNGIDQKAPAIAYWPLLYRNFGNASGASGAVRSVRYVIRTRRAGTMAFREELRQAVAGVNPNLAVADVQTLQSVYERSLARTSFTLALLATAGGMSLLLGLIGIFGVISYSVAQRTREIGIRIALGAPLRDVTRLFVRHGLAMSGLGTVLGLAGALALTRLMKSLLFEVSPADPVAFAGATAALIGAALLACYLPARQAAGIDPAESLRGE